MSQTLPRPLRGVITAMVTPLNDDLSLDRAGLARLIEHLIRGGVHGIFVLGTTGEAPSLPYEVRAELIEQSCAMVGGRVPVIVGITDTSFAEAVRTAVKAHACGAAGVVAAPPYYFSVTQGDLLEYFRGVAAASPLPLFLYNAPLNTHSWIEVATAIAAASEPNVVGVKDSGLTMGYFHAVREGVRHMPEFSLLVGPDELLAETVLMGGHGGMAGGSNVWPRLYVELYEAALARDVERVDLLQQKVIQFGNAVYRSAAHTANPTRGLKCALSVLGICGDAVVQPLQRYSREERTVVEEYVRGLKELLG